jgi:hypothetical protein
VGLDGEVEWVGARCSPFIGALGRGGEAGRDTMEGAASWLSHRKSTAAWRASWQGRDTGWGKLPAAGSVGGWSGPIGGRILVRLAGVGIVGQVSGGRSPSTGQNRGGERKERGQRRAGI